MSDAPTWVIWLVGIVSAAGAGALLLRAGVGVIRSAWYQQRNQQPAAAPVCPVDPTRLRSEFNSCRENREAAALQNQHQSQLLEEILVELRSIRTHQGEARADLRVLLDRLAHQDR